MSSSSKPSLSLALLLYVSSAVAQSNLGELLDSGAKKLSPKEFKDEVVQRMVVGPSPAGVTFEVMYAESGKIAGTSDPNAGVNRSFPVSGAWSLDDSGRVAANLTSSRSLAPIKRRSSLSAASRGSSSPGCTSSQTPIRIVRQECCGVR